MAASRVCSFVEPVQPVTMAKRSACSLAPFAAGLMPWAGMPSSPQIEVISVHQASTCPTLRAIFALAAPLLPRVQVCDCRRESSKTTRAGMASRRVRSI